MDTRVTRGIGFAFLWVFVGSMLAMPPDRVRFLIVLVSGVTAVPLIYGLITSAKALGNRLAGRAFAATQKGKVDPADAPAGLVSIRIEIPDALVATVVRSQLPAD